MLWACCRVLSSSWRSEKRRGLRLGASENQRELHITVGSHGTLVATVAIQTLTGIFGSRADVGLALVGLQWLVLVQAIAGLWGRWVIPSLYSVCLYYLSSIAAFGGTYYVCSVLDSSSFSFDRPLLRDETADDPSTFYFLSVTVQSLVGFGAVTAASYTTRTIAMAQQLAGLGFHAGIIAQALAKFKDAAVVAAVAVVVIVSAFRAARSTVWAAGQQLRKIRAEAEAAGLPPGLQHAGMASPPPSETGDGRRRSSAAPSAANGAAAAWGADAEAETEAEAATPYGGIGAALLLVQAYLSTILLFGGLYVSVFLAAPDTQPFSLRCGDVCLGLPDSSGRGPALASVSFFEVVTEMLYLASASLTGNGDGSVYPTRWWSRLVVAVSMLSGVLFNVVILAMGSSALQDMALIQDVEDKQAAARRRRRSRRRNRRGTGERHEAPGAARDAAGQPAAGARPAAHPADSKAAHGS
ncbi:hypothetical protein FNF31_03950 [Cafeteria roenbergensis]|uniref:Ion transport domain-containing protein n=1 Tax=Cafeteria roenbergensis TaxID=33653 RepID=A0A5A8E223_CAFRO|nr:hypothetical protein FNF31_03950 [Cafeteria roenbergensis]KAA0170877.1 hypothetical protein FNF28_01150 [Cafeteria roenbergensis]